MVNTGNTRNYSDDNLNVGDISIGKWHIPQKDKQSKINIQANTNGNLLPAHFVSLEFPKLLAEVKTKASQKDITHEKELDHHTCNNCDNSFQTS